MNEFSHEILEKVLAGELELYRRVVRTFEADVYGYAAQILGNRNLAEDVTQEVFVTAYRRLDAFDLEKPFRPWLFGIASHLIRNELRRQNREASRLKLYSYSLTQMSNNSGSQHERHVAIDALAKCREQLAQTAAEAIKGRYEEGLSLEALADRLQRSISATSQLLYRTRIMLRNCVQARLATEGEEI